MLTLTAILVKKKRDFIFEAYWQEHEDCGRIIKEAWSAPNLAKANLTRRIQAVTASLIQWTRKTFKNSHKQISALQAELQDIINDSNQTTDRGKQQEITDEIEKSVEKGRDILGFKVENKLAQVGRKKYTIFPCYDYSKKTT